MANMVPVSGGTSVATDALWDASGDLAYGTGSNTATRLGIGVAGQKLCVNSGATAPEWGYDSYWIRVLSPYTLPSDTNLNPIFKNVTTNGSLAISTGTYEFSGLLYLTSMSTTPGNAQYDLLGAAASPATIATALIMTTGLDTITPLAAAAQNGLISTTLLTAAAVHNAAAGTSLYSTIHGQFRVTAAGSLTPSVRLLTASAAIVQPGSYLAIRRMGEHSQDYIGAWT